MSKKQRRKSSWKTIRGAIELLSEQELLRVLAALHEVGVIPGQPIRRRNQRLLNMIAAKIVAKHEAKPDAQRQ